MGAISGGRSPRCPESNFKRRGDLSILCEGVSSGGGKLVAGRGAVVDDGERGWRGEERRL